MCKFCPYVCTTWEPGDQKRVNPLELELPASVSCAKWVLGIEPAFFGRAISLAHTLCVCVSKSMNVQKSESFGNTLCPTRWVPGDGTLCRDPQNHLSITLMSVSGIPTCLPGIPFLLLYLSILYWFSNLPRSKYCVPRTQFLDDSFSFSLRVGHSILRHSWFQPRYLLQILDSWSHCLPSFFFFFKWLVLPTGVNWSCPYCEAILYSLTSLLDSSCVSKSHWL